MAKTSCNKPIVSERRARERETERGLEIIITSSYIIKLNLIIKIIFLMSAVNTTVSATIIFCHDEL